MRLAAKHILAGRFIPMSGRLLPRLTSIIGLLALLSCPANATAVRFAVAPAFHDDFSPGWETSQRDWRVASWRQNDTAMSPERCRTDAEGRLVQTVLPDMPHRGGSLQTNREFGYGRWIARVKPSSVPGVLNSIFTVDWDDLRTSAPDDGDKSEVDIEFLTHTFGPGKGEVHLAIHLRIDGKPVSHSRNIPLDFNPSDDFREWGFDILPDGVVWHVDGREIHRWQATPEQKITPAYEFFFNSWTGSSGDMGHWIKGPPAQAADYHIDWVKFHPLETFTLAPASPPDLSVRVGMETLRFDPPDLHVFSAATKDGQPLPDAPADLVSERWPGALSLTPAYDPTRTHILGRLFRTFRPETLRVESADGSASYRRDIDYRYHEDLGLVANLGGRISGPVKASAEAALQRLDLIQRDSVGRLSVKKGESSWVCPRLPDPDAGHVAVAGVYIAPWRAIRNPFFDTNPSALAGASEYAVTAREIFPIDPAPPAAPVHAERLDGVLRKLRAGAPVKIALMGDSITLGAESTRWWNDKYDADSKTWKGRVIHSLRQRFPAATIEVVEAYKGGVSIDYGLERLDEVLAQNPALVIAAFGVNDAARGVGKRTPDAFAEAVGTITERARAAGADVLWLTPFPLIPWVGGDQARRREADIIPALRGTAAARGAALADVSTDYRNLNTRGIPWWSQNHNWHNHPGDFGHALYADTILRCFPSE